MRRKKDDVQTNKGFNAGANGPIAVTVKEKDGAELYIPQFDNINSRGGFRTVAVSNKSNKFIFDWDHSTNDYKVWTLDPSKKEVSLVISSEVKQGKLQNFPVDVSWSPDDTKIS